MKKIFFLLFLCFSCIDSISQENKYEGISELLTRPLYINKFPLT